MRKINILIVGKDSNSAKKTARILRKLSYSVVASVAPPVEAVAAAERERPQLVVMEGWPEARGARVEAAKRIYSGLGIPVLVLADPAELSHLRQTLRKLPFGFLVKPATERGLGLAVEAILARHALEKGVKGKAIRALDESEERCRQLVNSISEGVVILDTNGAITSVNDRFLEMIGYGKKEVIGHPITAFLGEGSLRRGHQPGEGGGGGWKSVELAWRRKDGRRIYTILSRKSLRDPSGRSEGTVYVLTDITDRREVELELRRSQEELRSLSQHIQSVREEESKRIAGEIHDVLGQHLTALKIDLAWLLRAIAPLGADGRPIQDRISGMSDLVDQTIQSVQKISAELRPVLLDDLGLGPAIEWLVQDFEARSNIQCRLRLEGEDFDLEPDAATAIFRISQEALTNVVRHARATAVGIGLGIRDGNLVLKINDNGAGIRDGEVHAPSSLGLMGMRERVRALGGTIEISGSREKGTSLTVMLPLGKSAVKERQE